MEKLNQLEIIAKSRADNFEPCTFADTKDILAIAAAFRDLEQRAEEAEAKLAELEKQEPVGKQYRVSAKGNKSATGWSLWHDGDGEQYRNSYDVQVRNVFTRPAPAVIQLNNDAMCDIQYIAGLQAGFVLGDRGDNDSLMRAVDAYRRQLLDSKKSAPAVILAELVPEEITSALSEQIIDICDGFEVGDSGAKEIWKACRANIMRNIEESK